MTASYQGPLDRLMKLGAEPARRRVWPDYRHLGLTDRHVPGLIQIATDPELHAEGRMARASWAPVHAWRALGQLGAAVAVPALLALLEREWESTWVYDEVPAVLGMIGPAALTGATLLLFDETQPEPVRIAAARVLADVSHEYPERRDEAVAILTKQLEDWARQGPTFTATLIAYLAELGAKEAAPLMEAAFAAGAVDLSINGDWEDVQIDLGLLDRRITPPTPWSPIDDDEADEPPLTGRVAPAGAHGAAKARGRRKAQKQARKRNRKKK